MKKLILKIDGMTCSACANGLEKYLNRQKNIKNASVNLILSIATIEYENLKIKEIEKFVSDAGFESLGEFKGLEKVQSNKHEKIKLILMGILTIIIMFLSMGHMLNIPFIIIFDNPKILSTIELLLTFIFLYYGKDILKNGIKNLIHRMPNMDTLVTFSVISSFFYSFYETINILINTSNNIHNLYFESSCMIIYFIKLGRYIENISKNKTKDAITALALITPQDANLKTQDGEKTVTIDEIKTNDILICRPGEKIAVDGIIIKGSSYLDESFITGESEPALKKEGSSVIAGSINYDGVIEYEAKKIGKDTTISEIVKLVVEGTNTKNKIQRITDKISGYFVPLIILIAISTFIVGLLIGISFQKSLLHFITVLVVACPCALGLAVPLVVVVSNGLCAKKGLFIKNSEVLENGPTINKIVFDKTGTLTYGTLKLYKLYNYSKYKDEELINITSNIENESTHPIKTAFKVTEKLEVNNFKIIDGKGIQAEINNNDYYLGNKKILNDLKINETKEKDLNNLLNSNCTYFYILENKKIIGLVGIKDIIRDEVKKTIKKLKENNIEPIMLTGDNEKVATSVGKELGITNIISNVLPKEKANYIDKLIKNGDKVIMVGDGINDAPALSKSTIGISINDGTGIAIQQSDVILMNNNLINILDLINISKTAYKIIKQNLFCAFFYNIIIIPIAMGLFEKYNIIMTPMLGSIMMTISSLTVVFNSLRLRRIK